MVFCVIQLLIFVFFWLIRLVLVILFVKLLYCLVNCSFLVLVLMMGVNFWVNCVVEVCLKYCVMLFLLLVRMFLVFCMFIFWMDLFRIGLVFVMVFLVVWFMVLISLLVCLFMLNMCRFFLVFCRQLGNGILILLLLRKLLFLFSEEMVQLVFLVRVFLMLVLVLLVEMVLS